MARLDWDKQLSRKYESGVDRGVLYPETGVGVAWNGIVSIEEASSGGEASPVYFDGVKTLDLRAGRTFEATLTAFSSPPEFSASIGELAIIPGFVLTRQPRKRFGLCYRTRIGSGSDYKIHLVYNATATPTQRKYATLNGETLEPSFAWRINAIPTRIEGYRPTAHLIVNSTETDPDALKSLENVLYGTPSTSPRLPSVEELIYMVSYWGPRIIISDETTGLSSLTAGVGDLTLSKIPGLFHRLVEGRLRKTQTRGLYRLE